MSGGLTFQTQTFRLHGRVGASISGTYTGPPASFFLHTLKHIPTALLFPFKYNVIFFFWKDLFSERSMVHSCQLLSDFDTQTEGSPPSLLAKHDNCKNCIRQQYLAPQTDQGLWLGCIFLCNSSRVESCSQKAKYKYSVRRCTVTVGYQ